MEVVQRNRVECGEPYEEKMGLSGIRLYVKKKVGRKLEKED